MSSRFYYGVLELERGYKVKLSEAISIIATMSSDVSPGDLLQALHAPVRLFMAGYAEEFCLEASRCQIEGKIVTITFPVFIPSSADGVYATGHAQLSGEIGYLLDLFDRSLVFPVIEGGILRMASADDPIKGKGVRYQSPKEDRLHNRT